MKRLQFLTLAAAALLVSAAPLKAQQQGRVSPPAVSGAVIDGSRVTVYYSRPHTKDPKSGTLRKIWGELVPFNKVWRLGANEAVMLVTQHPIEIGGLAVPAGASTLFLLPQQEGPSKLIVNRQVGQWGTQYDEKQDIGRVDLKTEALETPVDQFTMTVGKEGNGGVLKLAWENTQYSVPFIIKK